ncbi:MAG TPA: rhodanese-like domain-containing protein [Dissulfurispiraceae bacterium]
MRKINVILALLILSLALAVPASHAADDMASKLDAVLSKAPAEKFWQVSADDVAAMIKAKKTDFLVVDTRPDPGMFKAGHIPGAVYIPVQSILKPDSLKKLPKNKKVILVCVTGQTQNLPLIPLRALGYNAMTMKFGMASWDKSSLGQKLMGEALKSASAKNYPLAK